MLEQVLGQMGKELPDELTKRMSLNRFFAMQRDIVNDELESLVPDLIEDALENPTGSYQIVTKEQTRKLDQINKSNDEILTELGEIKKLLKKKIGDDGEDGSLLGSLLDMLGLGGAAGLGADALTGRRKNKSKNKNKRKPGIKSKGKWGLILAGLAAGGYLFGDELTGLDPGQAARDLGFGGLGDGIDTALDYGSTGLMAGAGAYAKIKTTDYGAKTPTATQTTSNYNNVVKDERLKGTKYYTQDPTTGKTKLISMAEGAAAEASGGVTYKGGATPTATPVTPKPTAFQNISSTLSKAKQSLISGAKWLGGKLIKPALLAAAVWGAWTEINELDKSLSYREYYAEVSRIVGNLISEFGITLVSASLGSLLAGAVGGAVTGGLAAVPSALVGFVGGLLAGVGLEYAIGDTDEMIINKIVDFTFSVGEYEQKNQPQTVDTLSGGAVNLAAGAQMPTGPSTATQTSSNDPARELRKQRAREESAKNRKEGAAAMAGLATETGNILFPGRDGVTKDELLVDEYNKLVRTGKVPQTLIDNLKEDMKNTKGLGTTIARAKIRSYTEDYVLADAPKNIIADENGVRAGPEPTATPVTNEADLPAVGASPSSGLYSTPEPAKDERNWWQRTMPRLLGGKESPTTEATPLKGVMASLATLGGGAMGAGAAGSKASNIFSNLTANRGALSELSDVATGRAKGLAGQFAGLALGGQVTGDKLKQLGVIAPDASKEEVDAAVKEYSDMTKNGPTLSPEQMAFETGTSPTAIQNMFAPSGRTVSETTIDNNPNAEFQKSIEQMMTKFQSENTGVVNNINAPAMSTSAMPKFSDIPTPTSMAITALRSQGLADVYSHPQAGSTIERSNRGGETTYI